MSVKNKQGFALIELLVVIFIMALLAALIMAVTSGARARGRDGRRKADIDQIKKAIELYRSDNGGNAPALSCTSGSPCTSNAGSTWIAGLSPTYISSVLRDPSDSATRRYKYATGGTNDFEIDVNFEDVSNNGLEANTSDNGNCGTRYETGTLLTLLPCSD